MTWNYRVIKTEEGYDIREVFYVGKIPHHINYWSESAIAAFGETIEELKSDICNMMDALDKPVLEEIGEKLCEIKG